MVVNHNKYRLFEYSNNPSKGDAFILGEAFYIDAEFKIK